jgi:hypothetical protein
MFHLRRQNAAQPEVRNVGMFRLHSARQRQLRQDSRSESNHEAEIRRDDARTLAANEEQENQINLEEKVD